MIPRVSLSQLLVVDRAVLCPVCEEPCVTKTVKPRVPPPPFASLLQAAQTYQQPSVDPCDMDKTNFGQCLQNNNNDVTACQFVFEALQTCQLESKKNYN